MKPLNAKNERIKYRYFAYLRDARGCSEHTVAEVAKALHRFEVDTQCRDFRLFRHEQASAFKRRLAEQPTQHTGQKLSLATRHATLRHLRAFFHWLGGERGYRQIRKSDADYFRLLQGEGRIVDARRGRPVPSLDQIRQAIKAMPSGSPVEMRNQALLAFTILSGARDGAVVTMKLKHVDVNAKLVHHDAREVKTKFRKTATTWFFPIGDDVENLVENWIKYLREEAGWGDEDPLFPATRTAPGASQHFEAAGLDRRHWRSAKAIRPIFKKAFERVGLPYFHPHSFRNTLARLGEKLLTAEALKAWSQNLCHEQVATTLLYGGPVSPARQREIFQELRSPSTAASPIADEIAQMLMRYLPALAKKESGK